MEWHPEQLSRLDPDAERPVWRLAGELDWDAVERLRILSARLDDGRTLAVVALRPARASGHGDESVAGTLGDEQGFERLEQVLLSTEYGPDGRPRRLGLELYRAEGELPLRLAADVGRTQVATEEGVARERSLCELRAADASGSAIFEVLARA